MAEDSKNLGPILSPDDARALQGAGYLSPEFASQFMPQDLAEAPVVSPDVAAQEQIEQKQRELQMERQSIVPRPGVGMGLSSIPGEVTEQEAVNQLLAERAAVPSQEQLFADAVAADQNIINNFQAQNQKRAALGAAPLSPTPEVVEALNRQGATISAKPEITPQISDASQFAAPVPSREIANAQDRLTAIEGASSSVIDQAIQANQALANKYLSTIDEVQSAAKQQEQMATLEAMQEKNRIVDAVAAQERKAEEAARAYQAADVSRPKGFFGVEGFWNQFLAGLSVGLAGVGGGPNQPNAAIAILQKSVDRDIEQQKFKRNQLGKIAENEQGLYVKMLDDLKDQKAAEAATKAQIWKQAQDNLSILGKKFGIQQDNQRFIQQMSLLQQKQAEEQSKLNQQLQLKEMIRNASKYNVDDFVELGEEGRKIAQLLVPGMGVATDIESAKVVKDLKAVDENVESGVNELMRISEMGVGADINPALRSRANTIAAMLVGELRLPIVGPGAVSERELDLLNSIIANPTKVFSLGAQERSSLRTLRERIGAKFKSIAKSRGITFPEDSVKTFNPEQ